MKTTLKATLALGAAGLSLLTLAGGAGAQITTGDPSLTTAFSTYNGKGQPNYTVSSFGVGYDANGGGGKLPFSPTAATSQSVYEAFTFDSSAAGTFSTLAAGSTAQLELFASNQNVNIGSNFDVYASLYAYNPNAAAGTVPATGKNLFGQQQLITLAPANGGYFTSDFSLAAPIVAGQKYVLGITTLTGDTQDFGQVAADASTQAGLTTSDFTFAKNKFMTDNNDQGVPTATNRTLTTNNVIAFELNAGSAPVPEGSMTLDFGLGLGVMGLVLVASKRLRATAK